MDLKKINFIIRILISSDFFLFFGLGLITPIFAIFILDNIQGSGLEVVGFATTAYWIARIFSVVPLSWIMDKIGGEKDEFYFLFVGSIIMSIYPILLTFATLPWHIYILELLSGFANSMAVPAWRIIFPNHIDRHLIGFEWSVEDVAVGVATALSATAGAFIAKEYGFNTLFIIVSAVCFLATFLLLFLYKEKILFRNYIQVTEKNIKSKAIFKVDGIK